MTLRGLLAPILAMARLGNLVSPNPLAYPRVLLLALAMLVTVVSIAPAGTTISTSLLYWDRKWGPDPKDYSASYPIGLVLPWVTVVHDWNQAARRSRWSYHSLDRNRFALHLVLQSLAGGMVMLLWSRASTRPTS